MAILKDVKTNNVRNESGIRQHKGGKNQGKEPLNQFLRDELSYPGDW